jgi:hypothetical protein
LSGFEVTGIGLGFGFLGVAGAVYGHVSHGGINEFLTPAAVVFTLLNGIAFYWGYRAVDYLSR